MAARTPDPKFTLVQLEGDDRPPARSAAPTEELAEPAAAAAEPDPDGFHVLVHPPNDADPEILSLDKELAGAEELVQTSVRVGYWIHGPGYFDAMRSAVNAPLANEYQGSQEPLRMLSDSQRSKLMDAANGAIAEQQKAIVAALAEVETQAAVYARERLDASRSQVLASTMRYIREADTRRRAAAWLETSDLAGGAITFQFVEADGIDLVRGMWSIWTAYLAVAEKEAKLAKAMKDSGKEMQQIAADRWQYLRKRDPARAPKGGNTYLSRDYGVELLRATNPNPALVAEAVERFPDPATVTAARLTVFEAAGILATTLVDEGAKHPLLYRIWSPSLAKTLHDRSDRTGSTDNMTKFAVSEFRMAVASALRSSWSAATSMSDKSANDRGYVWRFPLLITATVENMQLPLESFTRVAVEHRLEEMADADAQLRRFFVHASSVLTAASLAVRLVPAPAVSLPASVAIAAVDMALGGLGLLAEYIKESDTREGFRAFLDPGESFAASDGSYLGIVIGASFLLFGLAGFSRASMAPPTRAEMAIAGGLVAHQEYGVLTSTEPRH